MLIHRISCDREENRPRILPPGYVVELMLTLEAIVDSLDAAEDRLEWQAPPGPQTSLSVKDESSKPPVGAHGLTSRSRATSAITSSASAGQNAGNHVRSTSYSVSYSSKKPAPGSPTCEHRDVRTRGSAEGVEPGRVGVRGFSQANSAPGSSATNLSRSRSAQSLRAIGAGFDATSSQEDKLTIMAQLFCIAISLLESDYEHEFLLALRLIDKVSERFDLEKPECRDRVDRLIRQMRWPSFPGVHSLLLKGLTNPSTYEQSLRMISQMTTALDLHVIDPSQTVAFPLNVVALLPYMLHHYEDANELCVRSADKIAEICTEKSAKLENLATVMTLYSRRTFSKESFQWTKCVVKYLHDAYSHLSPTIISFLVEVLDHGPLLVHAPILSILHCLLHYVDIHAQKSQILNIDLLRPVAKFLESNNWKEALKILRLVVTRSSSLVVPPSHQLQSQSSSWGFMPSSNSLGFTIPNVHRSNYTEGSSAYKKELPGRTMEFSFDMSLTPIIAKKFPAVPSSSGPPPYSLKDPIDANGDRTKHKREDGSLTPKRSPSQTATDSVIVPGWKRPYMSQARTREKLVNLLTSCGQRIGLPKSPSVIFSQTSEVIEHPMSSMASSMEEVSPHDGSIGGGGGGRDGAASSDGKLGEESSSDAQFTVFKDFDFLENEESGGESEDNFNWGVKRSTLDLRGGASGSLGDPKETPPTSERSSQPNSESVLQPHSVASDDVVTAHARGAGSGASAATADGRDGAASSDGKLGEESSSDAQFTVFKDFDFLENEESGGESEDNFNWGVKRSTLDLRGGASGSLGDPKETPPTSERSSQPNSESVLQPHSVASDDVVTAHARGAGSGASAATAADDYPSSEEETGGSVSPLEHLSRLSEGGGRRSRVGATPTGPTGKASTSKPPPSSLVIGHGRRRRRQSQDSDSSYVHSSSDGDAGDLTPCNASPCLSSILSPHVQAEGAPPPPPLSMSTSSASENLSVVVPPTASMKASPESGGKSSVELIEPKQPEPELLGDTPMRHQQWVESEWRNLVTSLTIPMASRDFQAKPVLIAATPLRFTQLYKSLGVGLGSLVQMACDLLASESPDPWLSPLLIQLGNLSHTLTHTHPPFLWLDSWSVSSNAPASVLDMAKFNVLEIHEHFETFLDKREHAIECLEGVRSSLKLQALGEEPQIPGAYLIYMQDHQMDLSKAVNRLGFQLVSIWDSFTKLIASLYPYLVPNVSSVCVLQAHQILDVKGCPENYRAAKVSIFIDFQFLNELIPLEKGIKSFSLYTRRYLRRLRPHPKGLKLTCLLPFASEQRASDAECSESEAEQAVLTSRRHQEGAIGEDSLGDLLLRKQWKKAWDEFKLHRSVFSVELNNMADDMMAILHIYCKAYSTKYRGLFCLPADLIALQETISPLKESLMHLMTSLRQAEHNVASSAVSTSSKDSMQRSYC
ncbi:unnamed protein product [Notodromas monacha]|uniref:Protein furry n=1 Tax=Notodromas monacha TaxID=399045 RepID=A0A7R9BW56_9CRUS|nr:unnamed protein product [Notodromas monacha]CAG0921746.1 unnamed protein product [Notodromas monacha]